MALKWLDEQINHPSRADYYAMQIAQVIEQQWSSKQITLDSQKLKFQRVKAKSAQEEKKRPSALKAWHTAMTRMGKGDGSPRTRNRADGGKTGR